MRRLGALVLLAVVAACAPVKPWQRGALADRRMLPAVQPEREAGREHVLGVREGAQGGHGAAGGACGCN